VYKIQDLVIEQLCSFHWFGCSMNEVTLHWARL